VLIERSTAQFGDDEPGNFINNWEKVMRSNPALPNRPLGKVLCGYGSRSFWLVYLGDAENAMVAELRRISRAEIARRWDSFSAGYSKTVQRMEGKSHCMVLRS